MPSGPANTLVYDNKEKQMIAHVSPPPEKAEVVINRDFQIVEFKTEEAAWKHVDKYGGDVYRDYDRNLWRVMPKGTDGQVVAPMTED